MDSATLGAAMSYANKKLSTVNVQTYVDDWLDDHPEATTTVEDGAITKAKLNSSLQETVNDVADLKSAFGEVTAYA